jgi:hypothetical protein
MDEEFGLGIRTALDFKQALVRARVSLRAHGFSILSEMPAPPGVGEETGRRHLLMCVWEKLISVGNLGGPGLDVGDHLQCNVVIFEEDDSTVIASLDPNVGMEGWMAEGDAESAGAALKRALEQVAGTPAD